MPYTTLLDGSVTHASRFEREPITVSEKCPTGAIRHRMGAVHIADHDDEVADLIREAVAARRTAGDTDWTAELEDEAMRFALWCHAENLAEYRWVMGSH